MLGIAVADLEVGDGGIDLEGAQCRVVPAVFEDGAGVAGPIVIVIPVDEFRLGTATEEGEEAEASRSNDCGRVPSL